MINDLEQKKCIISCSGKFHAFALAEQLNNHKQLELLFTTYAYQKNKNFRKFAKRVDKEEIPKNKIRTNIPLAILMKGYPKDFIWNELYDKWVASKLKNNYNFNCFIGWSGMSLHSIKVVKEKSKVAILERGSSHILYQNKILQEEYKKFGKSFSINSKVIEKEIKEYDLCDFISIPSGFVKKSFIENGVPEKKLILNPYGASTYFKKDNSLIKEKNKFRILYLGTLSIRKGLYYLFEALKNINILKSKFEVWFIGSMDEDIKEIIKNYNCDNWKFFGNINHYELPKLISVCDIAIHPSLEEGLSMVITQMMSCGVPVIATTNTGAMEIIKDSINGYIIPIQSAEAIKGKIEYLFKNQNELNYMSENAMLSVQKGFTWNDYGNRYSDFIQNL